MSLIKTIVDYFRIKSIKAEDALINPVDQSILAIKDTESQLDKFKNAIAHAMAQNNVLVKQRDNAKANVEKYGNIATVAIKTSEDDTRQALVKKSEAQTLFNSLAEQIDANNLLISQQRKQLERSEAKLQSAKNNQAILTARMEGANARKDLASSGVDGGALSKLDKLQKAVDNAEGEAAAFEELNHTSDIPLEEKYNTNSSVEEELAQLKLKV